MRKKKIAIIGAGVNGLALALRLKQLGISAEVYERSETPRVDGTGIYIWPQGMAILRKLLGEAVLKPLYEKIDSINTLGYDGNLIHAQALSGENTPFSGHAFMFHRKRLYQAMISACDPAQIHFGYKMTRLFETKDGVCIEFENGKSILADVVIGADGLYSSVRQSIFSEWKPVASGVSVTRGISRYNLGDSHDFQCDIFAGPYGRIVTYPTKGSTKERYWFAAYQNSGSRPLSHEALLDRFSAYDPRLVEMLKQTSKDDQIAANLNDLTIGKTWHKGCVILVGDAAHTVLPTIAYGFSLGLENVYTLANALAQHHLAYQEAFMDYEERCLGRTREMSEISREFTTLFYHTSPEMLTPLALKPLYEKFLNVINTVPYADKLI